MLWAMARELGCRKRGVARTASSPGGGAGEEDRAAAMRQHTAGGFTTGQKAGIASQFPNLPENPLGGLQQRKNSHSNRC